MTVDLHSRLVHILPWSSFFISSICVLKFFSGLKATIARWVGNSRNNHSQLESFSVPSTNFHLRISFATGHTICIRLHAQYFTWCLCGRESYFYFGLTFKKKYLKNKWSLYRDIGTYIERNKRGREDIQYLTASITFYSKSLNKINSFVLPGEGKGKLDGDIQPFTCCYNLLRCTLTWICSYRWHVLNLHEAIYKIS